MQPQKVCVTNKRGEKLVGLLHDTGSPQVAVLCHGFTRTKEDQAIRNLAIVLQNEGISAFRFDFAGNGESEGTFEFGRYQGEVEDLRAVVEHFCGQGRVASVILGHSKGGSVVLLYASQYHDTRTVVNVSSRHNLKTGIVERLGKDYMEVLERDGYIDVTNESGNVLYRVTLESMLERLNTDIPQACVNINKNTKVLTVHGSADEVIPVHDAHEIAKLVPTHKLQIIEDADHGYTGHQPELASHTVQFIKENLQ